ncbi:MAG: hypothetical protein ABI410_24105, partial [Rhodoferax sp.]|uniref:hypothetical protein n=1 Tax=Rhodoferax sp. TaxID=50421 RepID=UPI0032645149
MTTNNIFAAVLTQHFPDEEDDGLALTARNYCSLGVRSGEDCMGRIGVTALRFKSTLIDFATEHLGARRTHPVRTAHHAAVPTPNRSLGLKRWQFPYDPC